MQLESRANSTSAIPPLTPIAPSHHGTDSLDCRDQQRPSATGDSGSGWRLPSGSQILPGGSLSLLFSRVMSRSEELSNWFGIPGTENLLEEYWCALRKNVLLQGRMYVFDHYLCFHSNVFGFSKKKVINFEDVVGVRKKSHFRFPNSIEVEVQRSDGRTAREFFTSFLSREDAFRIIMQCWSHAKPAAARLRQSKKHGMAGPHPGHKPGDAPGSDTLPYADPALIDGQSSLSGKPPLPSRSSGNSNMFGTLLSGIVGPSNKGNGGRASTAPIEEESMTSFDEALSVGAGASKEGKPAESGMFLSSLNSLTKGISKHARARSSPLIGPGPASTPTSASATAAMPSPSFFNTMAAGLGMGRPAAATTPTSSFAPPDASSSPLTAAGSGGGRRTGSGGEGGGGEGGQPISPTRRPTRIPPPAPSSSSQSRPRIPSYPWQGLPGAGVPVPAPPCLSPRTQSQSQGGICSTGPGLPLDAPAACGVGGLLQVSEPNGTVSKELARAQPESCAQGRVGPAMPTLQEMGSGEGCVARGVGAGSASAGGAAVRQSSSASALVADLRRSVSAAAEAQAGGGGAVGRAVSGAVVVEAGNAAELSRRGGGQGQGRGAGKGQGGGQFRAESLEPACNSPPGSELEGCDEDDDEEMAMRAMMAVSDPTLTAPPLASDAQAVVSEVVVGTPEDVFAVLLANDSHFLEDFLEAQGNRRINIKAWQRHEQLGHVRDIQFVAPIKGAFASWGVPHAQCYQSHRFCNYAGGHMVFETSQTMANIPYGDCFTVDVRWDIMAADPRTPSQPGLPTLHEVPGAPDTRASEARRSRALGNEPPTAQVAVSMRVVFSRRCMFKRVIESGTSKQVQETYRAMILSLRDCLTERWHTQQQQQQQAAVAHTGAFTSLTHLDSGTALRSSVVGDALRQSMRAPGLAPSLSTSAAGHLPQASPLRQSLQMPALSHAQHPLARSYPALGMPGLDPALEAASSLDRQTSPCKLLGHTHGPASAVALFPHALEGGVGSGPGARRGTRQGDGTAGLRQWLAKLAQARGPPDRTVLAGKPEGRVGWGRWVRAQVRGAVAVVADLLLGLLSDGMTPRLLLLTFLVGLMLVMQVMGLLLMVWLTVLRPAAAGSSQGSGPGIATQLPGFTSGPAAAVGGLAGVAGAGQEGVAGLLGWDGAGGVLDRVLAAERGYWQQRLVALTEELGVLQQRVGLVTGELTSALAHLAQQTAMAAAAAAMGAAGGEVAGGSQAAAAAAGVGVAGAATDEL